MRCGIKLDELLRRAHAVAKGIAPWRYGIAYLRSSLLAPCMYAIGIGGGVHSALSKESEEDRERNGAWFRELLDSDEGCRHLTGHFRDVYPANLLSTAHVNARVGRSRTLLTAGWGTFTPIDEGLWIWTVPEKDIPKARTALIRAELMICP
jgi:hypothetical protein